MKWQATPGGVLVCVLARSGARHALSRDRGRPRRASLPLAPAQGQDSHAGKHRRRHTGVATPLPRSAFWSSRAALRGRKTTDFQRNSMRMRGLEPPPRFQDTDLNRTAPEKMGTPASKAPISWGWLIAPNASGRAFVATLLPRGGKKVAPERPLLTRPEELAAEPSDLGSRPRGVRLARGRSISVGARPTA